jgi:hypothetical protein
VQGRSLHAVHVSGLNWEVVKTLTLKYGLHPLAVEDALRSVRHPRSKCDFYANHLYLQILVYHIHAPDRAALARIAEGIPDGVAVGSDEEEDSNGGRDGNWRRPAKAKSRSCFSWGRKNEGKIRLPEGMDAVFDDPTPEKVSER